MLFLPEEEQVREKKAGSSCESMTETAEMSIVNAARLSSDCSVLGIITETSCLIAREAHYHESCRRDTQKYCSHLLACFQ